PRRPQRGRDPIPVAAQRLVRRARQRRRGPPSKPRKNPVGIERAFGRQRENVEPFQCRELARRQILLREDRHARGVRGDEQLLAVADDPLRPGDQFGYQKRTRPLAQAYGPREIARDDLRLVAERRAYGQRQKTTVVEGLWMVRHET